MTRETYTYTPMTALQTTNHTQPTVQISHLTGRLGTVYHSTDTMPAFPATENAGINGKCRYMENLTTKI